MNIEFSEKEREYIAKNKGTYSPARFIRQLLRDEMKRNQESQQGAKNDNSGKDKK